MQPIIATCKPENKGGVDLPAQAAPSGAFIGPSGAAAALGPGPLICSGGGFVLIHYIEHSDIMNASLCPGSISDGFFIDFFFMAVMNTTEAPGC